LQLQLAHRPDLDASVARGRDAGGELDRVVQVFRVDSLLVWWFWRK